MTFLLISAGSREAWLANEDKVLKLLGNRQVQLLWTGALTEDMPYGEAIGLMESLLESSPCDLEITLRSAKRV